MKQVSPWQTTVTFVWILFSLTLLLPYAGASTKLGRMATNTSESTLLEDIIASKSDSELLTEFRARQSRIREIILNNTSDRENLKTAFLFIEHNKTFDFDTVVRPDLDILSTEQDADFTLMRTVRMALNSKEHAELLIPYYKTIPFWLTYGDITRVFWSENHMLMYSSTQLLLQENFPEEAHFFSPDTENLKERILWWLRAKLEMGFYEFFSHTYMRFTLGALMNLYDYVQDQEIKDLTEEVILLFFEDLAECISPIGLCLAASARDGVKELTIPRLVRGPEAQLAQMFLGIGDFWDPNKLDATEFCTAAVAFSDINLVPAMRTYRSNVYIKKSIGHSPARGVELIKNLTSVRDKTIAKMSIGSYAHPDYITEILTLVEDYGFWDHTLWKTYNFARYVPSFMWKPIAQAAGSVTKASIMEVEEVSIWRHGNSVLSSMKNYFPGHKGYQQIPWIAGANNVSVLTTSTDSTIVEHVEDIKKDYMNNQLPQLLQKENVLLIMYNPNTDLDLLLITSKEVVLVFNETLFDSVIEQADGGPWIFGQLKDSFVAIYRHCIGEPFGADDSFTACFDEKQTWVAVVGNEELHGSFQNFSQVVLSGKVETSFDNYCTTASVDLDGQQLQHEFCTSYLGNLHKFLILHFTLLVLSVLLCCKYCGCCYSAFCSLDFRVAVSDKVTRDLKTKTTERDSATCVRAPNPMFNTGSATSAVINDGDVEESLVQQ